jgi:hypothetical protein
MKIPHLFTRQRSLTVVGALFLAGTALAGPSAAGGSADAQSRYRQDMAFCDSGQSSQDLKTCRLEARNAFAEAKRGGLNDASEQYPRNAVARCASFQGDDRVACESRMTRPTRVEGSVEGGGLLRESVIVVPAN